MAELGGDVAVELKSRLAEFERDNPELVRELDLLGVEIDEYELVLAGSNPRVLTGNSSVVMNDME